MNDKEENRENMLVAMVVVVMVMESGYTLPGEHTQTQIITYTQIGQLLFMSTENEL